MFVKNMFLINVFVFLLTDTDRTVVVFMFKCTRVHMRVCAFVCHCLGLCVYVLSDGRSGGICDSVSGM